jgi:uncharacterized phage-associated protein
VSAHAVAGEIRGRLGDVGKVKLHKLLYYCQAWHLMWTGAPLFPESVKAWEMGPVVAALWGTEAHRPDEVPSPATLSAEQASVVEYVLARYGRLSGRDLIALTHGEDPWRDVYERDATPSPVITHSAMRHYFESDDQWRERQARVERSRARRDAYSFGPPPLDHAARAAIRRTVAGEHIVDR